MSVTGQGKDTAKLPTFLVSLPHRQRCVLSDHYALAFAVDCYVLSQVRHSSCWFDQDFSSLFAQMVF